MAPWIALLVFALGGASLAGLKGLVIGAIVGVIFNIVVGTVVQRFSQRSETHRAQEFVLDAWKRENPSPPVDWRPVKVRADFLPGVYDGYSSPMRWGEFAWPQFPAREAARVTADLTRAGGSSRYDQKLDSYFVRGPHEAEEVQVWGHDREVGKLYDIGGGQWKWREVEQ